jgi:hypothetical protein
MFLLPRYVMPVLQEKEDGDLNVVLRSNSGYSPVLVQKKSYSRSIETSGIDQH